MTCLKLMMGAAAALVLGACATQPLPEPAPETLTDDVAEPA